MGFLSDGEDPRESTFFIAIQKAIKHELRKEAESALKVAQIHLEKRLGEIVAGVAVNIMKHAELRYMRDRLIIEIDLREDKS